MKKYIFKNKLMIMLLIISIPLGCFFSIKFALAFQPIIDAAANGDLVMLKSAVIFCCIYAGLDCILLLSVKWIRESILKSAVIEIKNDLFSNIINLDMEKFNEVNTGEYISILDNDINLLRNSYFDSYLSVYKIIVSFIFSFVTVCVVNIRIAVSLIIVSLCSILIPKIFEKKLAILQNKYSISMKKYTSHTKDFFQGFQVIKSFSVENKIIHNHSGYNKSREEEGFKSTMAIFSVGWISMLFSTVMYVVTYIMGAYFVVKGTMTVGAIVSVSQLIGGVVAPLEQLPAVLAQIHSTKSIIEKAKHILNSNKEGKKRIIPKGILKAIIMDDVSFSYKETDNKAVNKMNLEFSAGNKYAIVGESGSGKSTIAKMILGFYKADSGTIFYDNNKIEELPVQYLYSNVGYVQQNTFIFDDTLRNNIALYKEYTDEEIMDSIKKAGLEDFLKKLPNGINSNLGENGNLCSGGERQRIGIARALICKTRFMIFDEATANLDKITADEILSTVLNLPDTSSIFITHQLSNEMLSKCNKVYVTKNGSIVEEDNFNELLANKSYFYDLYNA